MSISCGDTTINSLTASSNLDILLSYYNALVDKLNESSGIGTTSDRKCLKDLALKINAKIITNTTGLKNQTPSVSRTNIEASNISAEFDKLLDSQEYEDSVILRDMYKSSTIIFMTIFIILVIIYNLI